MRQPILTFVAAASAAVVLGAATLGGQDRVDLAMVERIRAEGVDRSKVLETFSYITNVTGARPTGSRAHKQAADYVRAKLAEWGLCELAPRAVPVRPRLGAGEVQRSS